MLHTGKQATERLSHLVTVSMQSCLSYMSNHLSLGVQLGNGSRVRVYLVYTSTMGVRLQAHKQAHTDLNPTFDAHGRNSDTTR